MSAAYKPWTEVQDIEVPVQGIAGVRAVCVPFVCAIDAEAVTRCAIISAFLYVRAIARRAQES